MQTIERNKISTEIFFVILRIPLNSLLSKHNTGQSYEGAVIMETSNFLYSNA